MTVSPRAPDAAVQISGLIFAVVLIDPQGRIASLNPAAEEMLGQSERRLKGQALAECAMPDDPRILDRLAEPDAQFIARNLTVAAGGRNHRVNLTCSPVPYNPGWRVLTCSEIGQGDHAEDQEERVELRAPAILAHEIKNPLSAIRGASQLLSRRANERDAPLTRLIAGEVDRIADLVDRMQQLGSRAAPSNTPCNLHQAIRNAMNTVRAGRGCEVEMHEEFDPSLPPVAADGGTLEQVLINLVANACDAADGAPGAAITVRTRFASGLVFNAIRFGKSTRLPIEVTVTDNGPGLDPALRDHVFEPFVTGKPGGQGLGLALVRKLVRDMGGRVGHEREERAGLTHFRINLPVAEVSPAPAEPRAERSEA